MEYRKHQQPGPRGKKRIGAYDERKSYTAKRSSCTSCGAGGVPLTVIEGVVLCLKCADKYGPAIRAEEKSGGISV